MTDVGAPAPTVVSIPADRLERHPLNPRPAKLADLGELTESIRVHGQQQPCVVTLRPGEPASSLGAPLPGTAYRIVIGHRRAAACRELGREVLCIVEDLDDEVALAIMLSDNEVRTDVDPFLEARAVESLLARPNWTRQSVAEALGKSPRWVARRANLALLRPQLRKAALDAKWPLEWMEDLAKVAPEVQEKISPQHISDVFSLEELDGLLAEHLQVLGKAPWGLGDETLLPKVGSCEQCPKTSLKAPGLFDAGEEAENPKKALRAAICRDSLCWARKRLAHQERQVEEARAAGARVVKFSNYGAVNNPPPFTKALPKVEEHLLKACKKDAPGAALALGLNYDGEVEELRWVQIPSDKEAKETRRANDRIARGKPAKEPPPAERLKESMERIGKRRAAAVDLDFKDAIANAPIPRPSVVMAFAAAFAVPRPTRNLHGYAEGLDPKETQALFEEALANDTPPTELIWPRVRETLAMDREPWMAPILGIDLKGLEEKARHEIPDPKSWASLEAKIHGKPAKAATKKPATGGAAAAAKVKKGRWKPGKPGRPPKWWTDAQKRQAKEKGPARRRNRRKPPVRDTFDGETGAAPAAEAS